MQIHFSQQFQNRHALLLAISFLSVSAFASFPPPLTFNSLPSAQGWTYMTTGPSESSIFSVDGSALHQNSLGTGLGAGGTAAQYYTWSPGPAGSQPFAIECVARVLQSETADSGGFGFSAIAANSEFAVTIDVKKIYDANGKVLSASIDTTSYHLYRLEMTPGVGYRLLVDGSVIATGAPDSGGNLPNQINFGDISSGGNARADITALSVQSVPEPATLLVMTLGIVVAVRRSFTR